MRASCRSGSTMARTEPCARLLLFKSALIVSCVSLSSANSLHRGMVRHQSLDCSDFSLAEFKSVKMTLTGLRFRNRRFWRIACQRSLLSSEVLNPFL